MGLILILQKSVRGAWFQLCYTPADPEDSRRKTCQTMKHAGEPAASGMLHPYRISRSRNDLAG